MRVAATSLALIFVLVVAGPSSTSAQSEDDFDVFGTHVAVSLDGSKRHLDAASTAGEAFDLGAMELALTEAIEIYAGELEWLQDHEPSDCYQGLHDDYRTALEANQEALDLLRQGVPDADTARLTEGTEALRVADRLMRETITGQVEEVALDCRLRPDVPPPSDEERAAALTWESSKTLEEVSPICIFAFRRAIRKSQPDPTEATAQDDPAPAAAIETSDPDLTEAIKKCSSLDEWVTASDEYPEALAGRDAVPVAVDMCLDEDLGLAKYTLCHGVRVALRTPEPSHANDKSTPGQDGDATGELRADRPAIGEWVTVYDEGVPVLEVRVAKVRQHKALGPRDSRERPKRRRVFLSAKVQYRGLGDRAEWTPYNLFDWKARDRARDYDSKGWVQGGKRHLSYGWLDEDEMASGWLTFDVPKRRPVVLEFHGPGSGPESRFEVKLRKR